MSRWFMFVACVTLESRMNVTLAMPAAFGVPMAKLCPYVTLAGAVLIVGRVASVPSRLNR